MTPLVSVILPVRNAQSYVAQAISMILCQTVRHFELIIVDDGSTDDTHDLILSTAERDPRVSVLTVTTSQGVGAARNLALRRVLGEYVWFADVDDTWSPRLLEQMIRASEIPGVDLIIVGAEKMLPDGSTEALTEHSVAGYLDGDALKAGFLLGAVSGHLWNKLIRRSLLGEDVFPTTRTLSDLAGMVTVVSRARGAFAVETVLYTYHVRRGSVLNSGGVSNPPDQFEVWSRCKALLLTAGDLTDEAQYFAFRYVFGYALNSIVRHSADSQELDLRLVNDCRTGLRGVRIATIGRLGGFQAALSLVMMKHCWVVYCWSYRFYRRVKWGSVSFSADRQ